MRRSQAPLATTPYLHVSKLSDKPAEVLNNRLHKGRGILGRESAEGDERNCSRGAVVTASGCHAFERGAPSCELIRRRPMSPTVAGINYTEATYG